MNEKELFSPIIDKARGRSFSSYRLEETNPFLLQIIGNKFFSRVGKRKQSLFLRRLDETNSFLVQA